MQGIAFFDFDGTISHTDTLKAFICYCKGRRAAVVGFMRLLPMFVRYKLGYLNNQQAKEQVLTYFFGGIDVKEFQNCCDKFGAQVLPGLIRVGALREIAKLKEMGYAITVVSASPDNWLSGWCCHHDLQLIASCLEVKRGCLTGRLQGLNCHGEEKVRRIKSKYNLKAYVHIAVYGDTSGDKPMLALATHQYYKPFRFKVHTIPSRAHRMVKSVLSLVKGL